MKKLLFIILVCLPMGAFAQRHGQRYIDSLQRKLRTSKEDTNRVMVLSELAASYATINIDEGIKYGEMGLQLAEELEYQKGIAAVNNALGNNYRSKADYRAALRCFFISLKIYESSRDQRGIAGTLGNIGTIHSIQGRYAEALNHFQRSLKINEALSDKAGIAKDLVNIGNAYQGQSNDAVALDYLLKALKLNEELNDKRGIALTLNSIGIVYIDENNFPAALENFKKALKINEELGNKSGKAKNLKNIGNAYFCMHNLPPALENYYNALTIYEELGDNSGIARNLGNIGNIYQDQHNYSKALGFLFRAYRINEELGEKYPMANNIGSIGCLYLDIVNDTSDVPADSLIPAGKNACLQKAVEYLGKAIAVDKEIGNLHELENFAYFYAEAQELSGNYKDAYESFQQYIVAKDSVFSVENNLKVAHLSERRESELRQKQIEMQQLKITAATHAKKYYLTGIAMLMVFSGGLYRRFRTARRTRMQLEEKNSLIAYEKEQADILRARAERSEQFKQQFLTNMSHEIRTPMNAVSGMTDLLLEKNPRPDQLHHLQIISRSSDILLHIINDILDLSKIESGKLEMENIDFSLSATIRQVKETLSFRAEEKGLYLVANIDDGIPDVLTGDPFRLNQVLINLGGNAIKFTERGSVEISVRQLAKDEQGVTLRFSITDTGIGIPEDKMNNLFQSFRQVQSSDSRRYGGTGLGLSISKQLVELQGGAIKVESEPGRGSVFSFDITYREGSQQRLQERTSREQRADGSMLDGLRILLTDDNEYNRMVASETLLSKARVFIEEATNGQEAIDLLESNDYDVILMDIQMPVMNGLDATRYIKSKLPAPKNNIPIIALTASLLRSDVDLCNDAGMNTYVPKPFKAWQLIAALAEATGRKIGPGAQLKQENDDEPQQAGAGLTDLAYLENFCEGDRDRMKKYIKVYMGSVPGFIDKVSAAMTAGDHEAIASQVHAFRPRWMMMGMKQSAELATELEKLCRAAADAGIINKHTTTLIDHAKTSLEELENKC